MKSFFCITILTALSLNALGADNTQSSSSSNSSSSPSEVRLSKLKDAKITSKSGEDLGKMEDLMIDPQTGKIRYVILGRGGLLGIGEKLVPVPWKAINVSSEKEFTLNVDKQKLKSAPTVDKRYSELNQPDYYVTIYRFYEVPMDTGSAEGPGGSQSGSSSSESQTNSSGHLYNHK
jgi:sporulation protein YlmC with PRC-barrel domain